MLTTLYCNIHGHPVDVFESENGDKYVSLSDVRKTGFQIFRKDKFKASLVDPGYLLLEQCCFHHQINIVSYFQANQKRV